MWRILKPIRAFIRRLLPNWVQTLRRRATYHLLYTGNNRYCPVCGRRSSQFLTVVSHEEYPVEPHYDTRCPYCHSFERHRFVYLYLTQKTDLFTSTRPRKFLHIAPEPCLETLLRRKLGAAYITADRFDPRVNVKVDICNIQFPDETFDVILCSHVLEHVPDDQKAMREFSRVLKKDGWAILLVPIDAEKTFEDPTITDPHQRNQIFGMDHVRRYGPDVEDRLRQNHFRVVAVRSGDLISEKDQRLMAIPDDVIFECHKEQPAPVPAA